MPLVQLPLVDQYVKQYDQDQQDCLMLWGPTVSGQGQMLGLLAESRAPVESGRASLDQVPVFGTSAPQQAICSRHAPSSLQPCGRVPMLP